jgi:hypothetical protein
MRHTLDGDFSKIPDSFQESSIVFSESPGPDALYSVVQWA